MRKEVKKMVDLGGPIGFLKDQLKKFDEHPLRRKKIPPYALAEFTTQASRDDAEKICKNCWYFSRFDWNATKKVWILYCTAKMVAYQVPRVRYFQNRWCPLIYVSKFRWPTKEKADEIFATCIEKARPEKSMTSMSISGSRTELAKKTTKLLLSRSTQ